MPNVPGINDPTEYQYRLDCDGCERHFESLVAPMRIGKDCPLTTCNGTLEVPEGNE